MNGLPGRSDTLTGWTLLPKNCENGVKKKIDGKGAVVRDLLI